MPKQSFTTISNGRNLIKKFNKFNNYRLNKTNENEILEEKFKDKIIQTNEEERRKISKIKLLRQIYREINNNN